MLLGVSSEVPELSASLFELQLLLQHQACLPAASHPTMFYPSGTLSSKQTLPSTEAALAWCFITATGK